MISEYKKGPIDADDLFPVIIYALIKAKIPKIKSSIKYIQIYRHSSRLESEEDYYFTTLASAITFIETVTFDRLNISQEDFSNKIKEQNKLQLLKYKEKSNIFIKPGKLKI